MAPSFAVGNGVVRGGLRGGCLLEVPIFVLVVVGVGIVLVVGTVSAWSVLAARTCDKQPKLSMRTRGAPDARNRPGGFDLSKKSAFRGVFVRGGE